MKKCLYYIMFCFSILLVIPVQAKIIPHLYQVQIPVVSQSASLRQQAINTAFTQVLVRISGNSQILQNSDIENAIANANNYLQQYSYIQVPLVGQAAVSNPDASRLNLQVIFDPEQIRQLLQQANQPVWGRDRPSILLWVVLSSANSQQFLSLNSQDPTISMLQQVAMQRGIPLVWPAIPVQPPTDVKINSDADTNQASPSAVNNDASQQQPTDVNTNSDVDTNQVQQPSTSNATTDAVPQAPKHFPANVSVQDILQPNIANINHFSQTYDADIITLVHLTNGDDGQWHGQWTLLINDQQLTWQTSGDNEWPMLQQGMNNVVDAVAQRYAVQDENKNNAITVTINNIGSLVDFAKAQRYLQQLTPIKNVSLLQINSDAAQFTVSYEGSQNDLLKAITLDHKLLLLDPKDSDFQSMINYQWQ